MSKQVLLVEDDEIIADFIIDALESVNLQVRYFENGRTAQEHIENHPPDYDLILLDRQLPEVDGLELLRIIKQKPALKQVPVIMETAIDDKDSINQGLSAGALYYLTKPLDRNTLLTLVQSAREDYVNNLALSKALAQAEKSLKFLELGQFRFKSIGEGSQLVKLLAQNFPDPGRVITGLQELMINAVEHGNLEIGYAEKTRLMKNGQLKQEINERMQHDEYANRWIEVDFRRLSDRIQVTFSDQGEGFEWRKYLDFDPNRVFDPHGRGIAMARKLSFDSIEYLGCGNQVRVSVNLAP